MAIYVAARDLAGSFSVIGTHQFIIISPDTGKAPPAILPDGSVVKPRLLGNGKSGYVIGAQNRGRLVVEYFEKSDYRATLEHFAPEKYKKWYKADLDTELDQVIHAGNDATFIRKILLLVNNYMINEREDNIPYPFSGLAINSNSWAQMRIPAIYFQAICPVTPRPKINQ